MAKYSEVIYDIREGLKKYTDDSELDDRYIGYLLNAKRAKYLNQKLNQLGRNFNNIVLQTFCLETEVVSANECGLGFECDNMVRTKKPIPETIQLIDKDAIERISPSNRLSQKFNMIPREKAPHYLNSPYSHKIKAFIHNDGHIYFISSKMIFLECVTVSGVFFNPLDLQNYKDCCNCDDSNKCFDLDVTDYPLQSELLDLVRLEVIKELAGLDNIPEDKDNDAENK